MDVIKVTLFLLTLIFNLSTSFCYCGDDVQRILIKGVKLNISEKFIYRNYSFTYKSVNRTCQRLSISGTTIIPIYHCFVR